MIRVCLLCLPILAEAVAWAEDDLAIYAISVDGKQRPAGFPDLPPTLLAVAEKPLSIQFKEAASDWQPTVQVSRVTSTRQVPLSGGEAKLDDGVWTWLWTPPVTKGPARYEIRFEGKPAHMVRVETRDADWLKQTLRMLQNNVDWSAQGMSPEERTALNAHGIRLERGSSRDDNRIASLTMSGRGGAAARRRVVWDERDPNLVVWQPGPVVSDLEIRAPRWWISPAALVTDQGLIRFLDLFSKPPIQP